VRPPFLDLTIIIPCRNDTAHLVQLLSRLAALALARQVIVVDDGSDQPLDAPDLATASGLHIGQLTLLHQDQPKGAGAARNQALQHVKTSHLLFLDADDLPTRELQGLCADLVGQRFEFCIFQHHDSQMIQDRLWGQTRHDQMFWKQAGVEQAALSPVSTRAAQNLVQTANYPWNKIYRTAFLHAHGIGCSEIPVHNDIELHWRSFLHARSILASDRIGVTHFVHGNGNRLTNQRGPDRLRVFEPLNKIATEIRLKSAPLYSLPFYCFTVNLLNWVHGTLQPNLQPQFATEAQAFLTTHLTKRTRQALMQQQPESYLELLHHIE